MSVCVALAAFSLALVGTGLVRHYALVMNLLDVPNERSSHRVATPRGGGLAVVAACAIAAVLCETLLQIRWLMIAAVAGGAIIVSFVGLVDDHRGLSPGIRIAAHAAAAALLVSVVALPDATGLNRSIVWTVLGYGISFLAVVWSINLFNFMDGIDGLAASQSIFVFASAATLVWWQRGAAVSVTILGSVAAASLGFLFWNWPRARIFMGDVGSGFLGFVVAAGALLTSGSEGIPIWTWIVLNGIFMVDATVTLAVRAARRERIYQAHRSHAYQRLARRLGSHAAVDLLYSLVNVCWLLPLSVATVLAREYSVTIVVAALAPLVFAGLRLGCGKRDEER